MAAVLGSLPGSLSGSPSGTNTQRRFRFGSIEPAVVTLLKFDEPLVAVGTLCASAVAYGERFTPALAGLVVLTFVISCLFMSAPQSGSAFGMTASRPRSRALLRWAGLIAVLLFLAFAFQMTATFSRLLILSWFIATPVMLLVAHGLRERAQSYLSDRADTSRYIIIGANQVGFELFRRLPQKGFLGFFDFRSADRVSRLIDADKLAGHCRDVAHFARTHAVTRIYVALPMSNVPRIGAMIRELRDTTASIYFMLDVFAFDTVQGRLVDISGLPAVSVCDTPFHGMDALFKRAFDIVVACIAALVLAPLMALIAFGVKLSSPGPTLFRQRRYGLHGEEIRVYKFRTMTVSEDGAVVTQARRGDQRITPFGGFLRRTSLDELPQLLNVLEGRMSLVGPRPHAIAHNEQYRKLISGYMIRHKVRPGITGWAQVNGLRGETETVEKMTLRVGHDIEYLNNWSLWLDVRILVRTVLLMLKDQNAY